MKYRMYAKLVISVYTDVEAENITEARNIANKRSSVQLSVSPPDYVSSKEWVKSEITSPPEIMSWEVKE